VIPLTPHAQGTVIAVKAMPGARKNSVIGERGGALRIAVTAAPERGKANEAVVEVLARSLNLKGSQISLLTGATSRDKRFLIAGIERADLKSRLTLLLGGMT